MTISQAHYRLVFKEHGVSDYGVYVACRDAKLIMDLFIDDLIDKLTPPKITTFFDLQNSVYDKAMNPRIFGPYPYTLIM